MSDLIAALTPHWQQLSSVADGDEAHRPRRPRHLSGVRALGPSARRPGQSLSGGLRPAPRAPAGHRHATEQRLHGSPRRRRSEIAAHRDVPRRAYAARRGVWSRLGVRAACGARLAVAACDLLQPHEPDNQPATVTVAFRWPLLLGGAWHDTTVLLPGGSWRNAFTGQEFTGASSRSPACSRTCRSRCSNAHEPHVPRLGTARHRDAPCHRRHAASDDSGRRWVVRLRCRGCRRRYRLRVLAAWNPWAGFRIGLASLRHPGHAVGRSRSAGGRAKRLEHQGIGRSCP